MKDNTRTLITLGVMAVLGLMFALASLALMQMHAINTRMATLVEVTNAKTSAANDMRDAIRLRADSLKNMQLAHDIFDRDEEYQRFIGYAGKYRTARERLVSLGGGAVGTGLAVFTRLFPVPRFQNLVETPIPAFSEVAQDFKLRVGKHSGLYRVN